MGARSFLVAWLLGGAALLSACGDDDDPVPQATGGKSTTGGASTTAGTANAGGAGGAADSAGAAGSAPEPLKPCLDHPDLLPRPPTHGLPCDLLPPDFGQ